eukprot:15131455-Heterocapsa_arctica.AAC.1
MHVLRQRLDARALLGPTPAEVNPLPTAPSSAWDGGHDMSARMTRDIAEGRVHRVPASEVKRGRVSTHGVMGFRNDLSEGAVRF